MSMATRDAATGKSDGAAPEGAAPSREAVLLVVLAKA